MSIIHSIGKNLKCVLKGKRLCLRVFSDFFLVISPIIYGLCFGPTLCRLCRKFFINAFKPPDFVFAKITVFAVLLCFALLSSTSVAKDIPKEEIERIENEVHAHLAQYFQPHVNKIFDLNMIGDFSWFPWDARVKLVSFHSKPYVPLKNRNEAQAYLRLTILPNGEKEPIRLIGHIVRLIKDKSWKIVPIAYNTVDLNSSLGKRVTGLLFDHYKNNTESQEKNSKLFGNSTYFGGSGSAFLSSSIIRRYKILGAVIGDVANIHYADAIFGKEKLPVFLAYSYEEILGLKDQVLYNVWPIKKRRIVAYQLSEIDFKGKQFRGNPHKIMFWGAITYFDAPEFALKHMEKYYNQLIGKFLDYREECPNVIEKQEEIYWQRKMLSTKDKYTFKDFERMVDKTDRGYKIQNNEEFKHICLDVLQNIVFLNRHISNLER